MYGNLLMGLMYGWPLAFWVAGIVVAFVWLSRGASSFRRAGVVTSVLWPVIPIALALVDQRAAQDAADTFTALCNKEAYEKIYRRTDPISEIFVEKGKRFQDEFQISEIISRLLFEPPSYREVHIVVPHLTDTTARYAIQRRGDSYLMPTSKWMPVDEKMTRYGVKFKFVESAVPDRFVREFLVQVVDRRTKGVLAEQRSYLYRSKDIALAGYPLWHLQERSCPLAHTVDFIRWALVPTQ